MIEENQIRKFKDSTLPNIKILFHKSDNDQWECIFEEEFTYQYISLTEKKLIEETELIRMAE